MKDLIFEQTVENVRKHRDFKTVTTERIRNYLMPESNYKTTKFFPRKFINNTNKKTEILMNKPVYLGLSTAEVSKELNINLWVLVRLCKTKKW